MEAAARHLYRAGYGDRHDTDPIPAWDGPNPLHIVNALATPITEPTDDDPTTWADLSWIMTGERRDPPPPTHLTTANGNHLFYRARINGLFGDPETAKSWIAMAAISQALNEGERAAYLDADHNGANEIASRLIALGAKPQHVADPDTFRVYEPEHGQGLLDFVDQMHQWAPDVVVIDSLGEIVPMLGLKSTDNDDLTRAIRRIIKPLAHDIGACVITIDHLPKGQEARASGYAIGGIAKKRAIDGSYFLCEATLPPAPGKLGKVRMTVEKDRHGHVRGAAVGRTAGIFHLDSTRQDDIKWHVEVPAADSDGQVKPTSAMAQVSKFLDSQPNKTAESQNQIALAVREVMNFGNSTITRAINTLKDEGYVQITEGTKANKVTLIKPFIETLEAF
jgi:hypothetical protein